ncbi:hypothetical protein [Acetobacter sp.]|uniref:hypothetical protein n=1 Tax=Acetobacter sp. TaxID=440 RepID=UPI0039E891CC
MTVLIAEKDPTSLSVDEIGCARTAISRLAWINGITGKREPVDTFVDAAAHLSGADASFDHYERLLIEIGRRGVLSDEECFALHAAYLTQRADGV